VPPWGLEADVATVASLASLLVSLLEQTLSGDKIALASMSARRIAMGFGVPPDEFERVRKAVVSKWIELGERSPIMRALGAGGDPNG